MPRSRSNRNPAGNCPNCEALYEALYGVTDAYWGVDDDHAGDGGEPPSMIVKARAALTKAKLLTADQMKAVEDAHGVLTSGV